MTEKELDKYLEDNLTVDFKEKLSMGFAKHLIVQLKLKGVVISESPEIIIR